MFPITDPLTIMLIGAVGPIASVAGLAMLAYAFVRRPSEDR